MKTIDYFVKLYQGILSTPKKYIQFITFSSWQLLSFTLLSCILLGFIWSAKMIRFELGSLRTNLQQTAQEFRSHYPEELVVSWENERLSLQPEQQYSVYYPSFVSAESLALPSRIADLIPRETDVAQLNNLHRDSLSVITPTQLHVQSLEEEWQTFSLTEVIESKPFKLDKSSVDSFIKSNPIFLSTFWQQLNIITIFSSPVIVLLGMLWNGLVLYSLAFLLAIKLYQAPITGKQLYKISFPIMVVATLIHLLAELLYGQITIPLLSIAYWILLLLVIRRISLRKTIHKAKQAKK